MSNDPVCAYLGLAARGRNLVSGEFSTETAIKKMRAKVVIVANDASDNTKKKFKDMCTYRNVPLFIYADKEILGQSIGTQMRASVAVLDEGLAKAIISKIDA